MLRFLGFAFVFLFLSACEQSKRDLANYLIKPLDTVVDYKNLDALPEYPNCGSDSRYESEWCTRDSLYKSIALPLLQEKFHSIKALSKRFEVRILVDKQGQATLYSIEPQGIKENIPGLYLTLEQTIADLPVLKPAIKQGHAVDVYYRLPININ